jgi:hypothetical protein
MSLNKNEVSLVVAFVCALAFLYATSDFRKLERTRSAVDNEDYYVLKDRNNKLEAANMLARAHAALRDLVAELKRRRVAKLVPADLEKNVDTLIKRTERGGINLYELVPDARTIAENRNKGEMIFVCMRQDATGSELGDFDTLLYVLFHELAHSMKTEYDDENADGSTNHSAEFHKCEQYLYKIAEEKRLFDAAKMPMRKHCGARIPIASSS